MAVIVLPILTLQMPQGQKKMSLIAVSLSLQCRQLLFYRHSIPTLFLVLHIFSPQSYEMMLSGAIMDIIVVIVFALIFVLNLPLYS